MMKYIISFVIFFIYIFSGIGFCEDCSTYPLCSGTDSLGIPSCPSPPCSCFVPNSSDCTQACWFISGHHYLVPDESGGSTADWVEGFCCTYGNCWDSAVQSCEVLAANNNGTCDYWEVDCPADPTHVCGNASFSYCQPWGCTLYSCLSGNPPAICYEFNVNVPPCAGSTDPCCGSTDPCCGSTDPCCGSTDPCCGSTDLCCGSFASCCGSSDPCCGSTDPCCGSTDPCCGKIGDCKDTDTCLGSSANYISGNLFETQEIVPPRGTAFPIFLTFAYNSLDIADGPLGRGWTHNYNIEVTRSAYGSLTLKEESGKKTYYY